MSNSSIFNTLSRPPIIYVVSVVGIFLLVLIYLFGAMIQFNAQNTDLSLTDQGAYLVYTKNLLETNYTFVDGARPPLYMMLQSLFYDDSLTDEAFFQAGVMRNIALSVFLLMVVFFVFRHYLDTLIAFLLTGITAFTVVIFKSPYYQPELLYYTLFFVSFAVMLRMFTNPSWRFAIIAGISIALAYLSKSSSIPALALFLVLGILQIIYERFVERIPTNILKRAMMFLLVGVLFLIITYPHNRDLTNKFGVSYYNVNSFYIWYDSWDEAVQGMRAHGDREGWPDLPPEEIPSLSKYLSEHSISDIIYRFVRGAAEIPYHHCWESFGHCKYVVFFTGFALWGIVVNFRSLLPDIKKYKFSILFAMGIIIGYMVLFAWFLAISSGERHILPLYLPVMFSSALVIRRISQENRMITVSRKSFEVTQFFYIIMTLVLILDVVILLPFRISTIYGGG